MRHDTTVLSELRRLSAERLRGLGAEPPEYLPLIEGLGVVRPRPARDVAGRICAISYLVALQWGVEASTLQSYLAEFELDPWVTEGESQLFQSSGLSSQDKLELSWLPEAAQALAWTLGLVELDCQQPCDDDLADKFPPPKTDPREFIASASLRSIAEIQAEVDFYYRLHWCVRQAEISGPTPPVDPSIVIARRRALEWVYGVDEHWDEISLDT